jgi:hypothetical protein
MKHSTTVGIHHLVLVSAAGFMCSAFMHCATATEVYKWTDANGQVHFGDRLSAPSNGQKIDVKAQPANQAPAEQRESLRTAPSSTPQSQQPFPNQASRSKSTPADPSKIGPGCQDLVEKISKVKPGVNWQSLYQKFNATCPGIAYECNTYRTHPENNKCLWIERKGSNVMQTNSYE